MRRITVVGMIILGLVAVPLIAAAKPAPTKVDVCHSTGDGEMHTINISEKAAAAHLAHGDSKGMCDAIAPDAVPEPNQAPTARITESYLCDNSGFFERCWYELSAAGSSDPEGTPLIYFWTVNDTLNFAGDTLILDANPNPLFTVTLIVSDGELLSEPALHEIPASG